MLGRPLSLFVCLFVCLFVVWSQNSTTYDPVRNVCASQYSVKDQEKPWPYIPKVQVITWKIVHQASQHV